MSAQELLIRWMVSWWISAIAIGSKCRKLHGAAFATWGGVLRAEFTYTSGESEVNEYAFSDNSGSVFCRHCGSRILVDSRADVDMLYIAMGTVDGAVSCPRGFHEYVGSKSVVV